MSNVLDSDTIVKKLDDLIELDYDAIAAYKEAVDRFENPAFKTRLKEFLGDHERHVEELSKSVRAEGGTPPTSGDFKKVLTKGQVVLADLGDDKAILKAMKINEDQTNSKYEQAVEEGFPDHIQTLLEQGLSDERRHREWIKETIDTLP